MLAKAHMWETLGNHTHKRVETKESRLPISPVLLTQTTDVFSGTEAVHCIRGGLRSKRCSPGDGGKLRSSLLPICRVFDLLFCRARCQHTSGMNLGNPLASGVRPFARGCCPMIYQGHGMPSAVSGIIPSAQRRCESKWSS
jgi:hypothetical protein